MKPMLHELRMQLSVSSSGCVGKKGDDIMHDVNEYIVVIRAIVDQLLKADLNQLKKLYIFIREYVKED